MLLSLLGSVVCFVVAGLRMSHPGVVRYAKTVVLICLECLLGITFALDLVRACYYMRPKLQFTHMVNDFLKFVGVADPLNNHLDFFF